MIDYKTGAAPADIADRVLGGGGELQRCLYACVAKALLGGDATVEAALLYPRADPAYHKLPDTDAALNQAAAALCLGVDSLRNGRAVPGPDTGGKYDALAFALPAAEGRLLEQKKIAARELLGAAADIWEAA